MNAFEEEINAVNAEADKLVDASHPDEELIKQRRDELNVAWEKLKREAEEREKHLSSNHEIQRFNR